MNASPPLPALPRRTVDSHKGDFGHVLLIGGSTGMAGAISLAGRAALRSGAGLVTLAVPASCLPIVAGFEPSYMTVPLPEDGLGRLAGEATPRLLALAEAYTCIACGPGLGRSSELTVLVGRLYRELARPMVFDADALNGLSHALGGLTSPGGPRVITPHPGEFRRLIQQSCASRAEYCERAIRLAQQSRIVVLLKGHRTLTTDGTRQTINQTGNPGMATGGAGDVLTGIVVALLAQGLSAYDAARLGAHLHGIAGDRATEVLGQVSLMASDLIEFLPSAFLSHDAMTSSPSS